MPLAPVVRAVPGGAEPVAQGGHGVGVEEVHSRIGRLLGQTVGVRHAVERRVLTGEQRGTAGGARGRARVVAVELPALGPQPLAGWELRATELAQRVLLVGRWVTLLVGHDDEHVRAFRHGEERSRGQAHRNAANTPPWSDGHHMPCNGVARGVVAMPFAATRTVHPRPASPTRSRCARRIPRRPGCSCPPTDPARSRPRCSRRRASRRTRASRPRARSRRTPRRGGARPSARGGWR